MKRLENKIAIITGAASGMGAAQARLFAREGARVVLADISQEGKRVAEEIGNAAAFCQLDVTDEASWAHVVAFTIDRFGAPTILVNTAGIVNDTTFIADTSAETFGRIVRINQVGPFYGIKAVVGPMKDAGGGAIVNIASAAAFIGSPGLSAYSSSKGGLRMLSRTAANELGPFGIRVNTIFPGGTKTPIVTDVQRKLFDEFVAPQVPLGRMGEPEEIANATLFLASDEASYITGAELAVDGGFLA